MQTNYSVTDAAARIRVEKRRLGLIYGALAGLALSLGIWGLDAIVLSAVNTPTPWLKFVLGTPVLVLIGALAGWLTVRVDNGLVGGVAWLLIGIAAVAIAGVVPFQGLSTILGYLAPEYAGLDIYPFVASVESRMVLLMISAGLMVAVLGALQMMFIEGLIQASGLPGQAVRLVFSMALFLGVGLLIDSLINQPLRRPLVAMDDLIHRRLEIEARPDVQDTRRIGGLSAIAPLGDMIHSPYQLSLGTYDPDSLAETSAYLNFDGVWSTCFVVEHTPLVCHPSADRYIRRLACLIESSGEQSCSARLLPGARESLQAAAAELAGRPLEYGILGQRGSAVIAIIQTEGDAAQVQCLLREQGDVYIESCASTSGKSFVAVQPSQPPQAAATEPAGTAAQITPTGAPASNGMPVATLSPEDPVESAQDFPPPGDPAAALLPAARPDLAALTGVPAYTIQLDIDPGLLRFGGRVRLEYTNREDTALDELYFRLLPNGHKSYGNGALEVTETRVAGQIADTELSVEDTVMRVALAESLPPGGQVQVELDFTGQIPEDFGGSDTPAGYGIYNLSEGVLALSGWYPILAVYDENGWNLDPTSTMGDSVYSDTALFTVNLCAPSDLAVAATGVAVAEQDTDGTTCTQIVSGPVRDFFIAASRDFEVASEEVDGVTINSYYLPGHEDPGRQALQVSVDSLRIYNEKFGAYPFTELDVIDAPMRNALGVEYPGIILVAQSLYDTPERPDFAVATSHEVAHQWWYSVIGNDVFEEPWLDEALTSFSSTLYYEYGISPQAAEGLWGYWQERYDRLKAEGRDDPVARSLMYFEEDSARAYGTVVYNKGALFFNALRLEIGDDAFFSALQQYYRDHKYQIARGEDLLNAFNLAAGRDLSDFYDVWLFSASSP